MKLSSESQEQQSELNKNQKNIKQSKKQEGIGNIFKRTIDKDVLLKHEVRRI